MTKPSAVTVTLRLDNAIKDLLQAAADKEHRSMANMVEVLILRHCEANGVSVAQPRKARKPIPSNPS
jgi:hypothetical protein